MGEAFFAALSMPKEERQARMRRLRDTVRRNNVFKWAGSMLLDAVRVREQAYPAGIAARDMRPGISIP
jgi:trehalose 6-phosphate synthase